MSSEALVEDGLGETRAVVVEQGAIAELHIERHDEPLRAGEIWDGRLARILVPGVRGLVEIGGVEALLEPLPRALTDGARVRVEVVREAIPEAGRPRLPKVAALPDPAGPPGRVRDAPTLAARLAAAGYAVRAVPRHGPDLLEAAGWSEAVEEAATGVVAFDGGLLTLSLTPAMTVIDVDGALPPPELAVVGARAAAAAIRRHGVAGSIGIDLPTVADKAARAAAGAAIDAGLPKPFERTAVNGFGFVQIVRRRLRASTLELIQGDRVAAAALALLRRAEREPGAGARALVAAPAVVAWLAARPALTDALARATGGAATLHDAAHLAISAGRVDLRPL